MREERTDKDDARTQRPRAVSVVVPFPRVLLYCGARTFNLFRAYFFFHRDAILGCFCGRGLDLRDMELM